MPKKLKILIADFLDGSLAYGLRGLGHVVDEIPDVTREEFLKVLPQYHGVVLRSKFKFGIGEFEIARNLKFIGRGGAGLDGIDLAEADRRGIQVLNAPEGNARAVAEHSLGMAFMLVHNLKRAADEVEHYNWRREENRGSELSSMTVGILGFGHMGREFGELIAGICARTIFYDVDETINPSKGVESVSLEEFKAETDLLSIHIQLTEENVSLINKEYLRGFKNCKYLINTSRGKVVDIPSIIDLLKNKKLDGVALDVLPNERLDTLEKEEKDAFEWLCSSPSAIITPHIAGWSKESYQGISEVLLAKIQKHILQIGGYSDD